MRARNLLLILIALTTNIICFGESIHVSKKYNTDKTLVSIQSVGDSIYSNVTMEDAILLEDCGSPSVCSSVHSYALPVGAKDISITNVITTYDIPISLSEKLMPVQSREWYENEDTVPIYANNRKYVIKNQSEVRILSNDNFHFVGQILSVVVDRIKINENACSFQTLKQISFDIEYSIDNKAVELSINRVQWHDLEQDMSILESLVDNTDDVVSFKATLQATKSRLRIPTKNIPNMRKKVHNIPVYPYCIITTRSMAPALERLVALKEMKGIDAGIVCMEDILEELEYQKGDTISNIIDDAGCLRRYLLCAYENGTRYVFLAGRPPLVPIRYGYNGNENNTTFEKEYNKHKEYNETHPDSKSFDGFARIIPSDKYFSNLTCNWNKDNDSIYGETSDGVSFTPDLWVGRLLCKDQTDIVNYLDKLEIYELNPGGGDYSYLSNAFLHFAYQFFKPENNAELAAEIGSKYSYHDDFGEIYNPIHKLIPNIDLSFQNREYPMPADIMQKLNDKKYVFVDFHGHGAPDGVGLKTYFHQSHGLTPLQNERVYHADLPNRGFDLWNNFMYPAFSYSASCTLMPFDSPKYNNLGYFAPDYDVLSWNVGESFTMGHNYGGVAFLGNTRYGWVSFSGKYEKRFFECLNDYSLNTMQLGVAEALSMYLRTSVSHSIGLAHNMLGDPSVELWRQKPIKIPHPSITNRYEAFATECSLNFSGTKLNLFKDRNPRVIVVDNNRNFTSYPISSYLSINLPNLLNSYVYITGDNCISPRNLNYIFSDFSSKKYFYCDKAYIGNFEYKMLQNSPSGQLIFPSGEYTIDANDDVVVDNILLKEGTYLIIKTPGVCDLKNVITERYARLKIQAKEVNIHDYTNCDINCIRAFYEYDKYRVNPLKRIAVNHIGSFTKAPERNYNYIPMLEEGKTWKYVMWNSFYEKSFTIYQKIEGKTNINGTQYYCLNQYDVNEGNPEFTGTLAYLREDIPAKRVICLRNNDFNSIWRSHAYDCLSTSEEEVLYDFMEPANMTATDAFYTGGYTEAVYMGVDGVTRSTHTADNSWIPLMMTEGLGWLSAAESFDDQTVYMGDLFGPEDQASAQISWNRYLYEISDAEGNILYKDEAAGGLLADAAEIAYSADCSITRHGNAIAVKSGGGAIGQIKVFSATGMVVRDFYIENDSFELNVEGYMPGVYIVTAMDAMLKFVVR